MAPRSPRARHRASALHRTLGLARSLGAVGPMVLTIACGRPATAPAPAADREDRRAAAPETPAAAKVQAPSPDELADLASLCAAIDHDYIDGTLSDYYGGVTPTTEWGRRTREGGDVADRPGRHLEGAARGLIAGSGTPMPAACTRLFEQLEELE